MLVLTRKLGEAIQIGSDITVRVTRLDGGSVRLAIQAPASVRIFREEVYRQVTEDNKSALLATPEELHDIVRLVRRARLGDEEGGASSSEPPSEDKKNNSGSKKSLLSESEVTKEQLGMIHGGQMR